MPKKKIKIGPAEEFNPWFAESAKYFSLSDTIYYLFNKDRTKMSYGMKYLNYLSVYSMIKQRHFIGISTVKEYLDNHMLLIKAQSPFMKQGRDALIVELNNKN